MQFKNDATRAVHFQPTPRMLKLRNGCFRAVWDPDYAAFRFPDGSYGNYTDSRLDGGAIERTLSGKPIFRFREVE